MPAYILGKEQGVAHHAAAPEPAVTMAGSSITLQEALISELPASGYYIPNFISSEEEAYLLHKVVRQSPMILCAPLTKSRSTMSRSLPGNISPIVASKPIHRRSHRLIPSSALLSPPGSWSQSFLVFLVYLSKLNPDMTTSSAILPTSPRTTASSMSTFQVKASIHMRMATHTLPSLLQ